MREVGFERGGLGERWVELSWRAWCWGRQGLRRWVGLRGDWKSWIEVEGVRFGEAGLK